MMKQLFGLLLMIFVIQFNYAQKQPKDYLGAWYMIDGTHKVADKFSVKTGFQYRTFEVLDNVNLLFYYTGVNYHLNKNTTFTLAYCYLDIDRSFAIAGENHLYENRPYEQFTYKHNFKNLPIQHRLRLEHRFLNYKHDHSEMHRIRYRLGTKLKINKTVFFNISNEFFANLKDETFTENRFYAAFGFNVSKTNNIQIGYLNHEINKQNLHRLQVGFFFKTDLRKKN